MAPSITKLICGIFGWYLFGWIGALVGFFIVGWAVCILIGTIAGIKDKGLYAPEVRRYIALEFARDSPDIVNRVTLGLSPEERQLFLESSVERVAKMALMLSQGYVIQNGGMDRAGNALAEKETEPNMQDLYRSLADYIAKRGRARWAPIIESNQ